MVGPDGRSEMSASSFVSDVCCVTVMLKDWC